MKERGEETRQRILEAACRVFAENGYRDATHAAICGAADANIASINYHFHSKEGLYREVFVFLSARAEAACPLDGGLSASSAPEERLNAFIHALLSRIYGVGSDGYLHRIRMAERFAPTGLLDEQLETALARDRGLIHGILRDLLGADAPEEMVIWCEMSLVGQCLIGVDDTHPQGPRTIFGLDAANRARLADHVYHFSLGGIRALRKELPSPASR